MILLNFSHPLTPAHLERIETLAGRKVERVIGTRAGDSWRNRGRGP